MNRQRGLAAVTALLIVAVAASAAAMMLRQQSAMLDQTAMVAGRAQADAYAQAGFDWARGILAEDAKGPGGVDSLDEGWAQPIAGLPIERAVVAGAIVDEQGKLNLNNLLNGAQKSEPDMKAFGRLLASVGLAPELAEAVLDWIDADSDLAGAFGAEDAYYLSLARPYRTANQPMQQIEELYRVKGFDAPAVAKLKPYVTALPVRTKVNANTAPDLVLAAYLPDVPADTLRDIAARRRAKPMRSASDIVEATKPQGDAAAIQRDLDVKSAFFQVTVQVSQDEVQLAADALMRRDTPAGTTVAWRRPRF